jgi:hypothetical protein
LDSRETGLPPANRGAGGRGRFGLWLPPYRDEGVPGRGLPCMCSGSKETVEAGGRGQSLPTADGVHGLEGDVLVGDPDL